MGQGWADLLATAAWAGKESQKTVRESKRN